MSIKTKIEIKNEGRKEMFSLTMHSRHFIYGFMASSIWYKIIQTVREETPFCHYMGYFFQLVL